MKSFQARFLEFLKEAPEVEDAPIQDPVLNANPDASQDAFQGELDKGTDPTHFDVKALDAADSAIRETKINQIKELDSWINKIDEFTEFLNGTEGNSIQAKLHDAKPESIFEKIASSESKKLSKIASELSGLSERLKAYLIGSKTEN